MAFYWELGKDIVEMNAESRWGSGFIEALSKDLKELLPAVNGLSPTNLRYIKRFYQLYSPIIQAQVVTDLPLTEIQSQVVTELDMEELFSIPWGHHRNIISKCQGNHDKAVFYIKQTIENGWSRAVLLNFLDTDIYERQGNSDPLRKFYKCFEDAVQEDGLVSVLRHGFRHRGMDFKVCYFKPESTLNEQAVKHYQQNVCQCIRQWHYTDKNKNSVDMMLAVNGIPIIAIELKTN